MGPILLLIHSKDNNPMFYTIINVFTLHAYKRMLNVIPSTEWSPERKRERERSQTTVIFLLSFNILP
jgi:hypothetical protein